MSRQMVKKISCGFCKKAGFFGKAACHPVKECPVLAKTECRYCHKMGHTKSHCQVLKVKNERRRNTSVNRRSNIRQTRLNLNGWTQVPKGRFRTNALKEEASSKPSARFSGRYAVLEEQKPSFKVDVPKVVTKEPELQGVWGNKPIVAETPKVVEEPKVEYSIKEMAKALKVQPALMVKWGDAAMEEDSESDCDSDCEEEIVLDSFGRPTVDNSAW